MRAVKGYILSFSLIANTKLSPPSHSNSLSLYLALSISLCSLDIRLNIINQPKNCLHRVSNWFCLLFRVYSTIPIVLSQGCIYRYYVCVNMWLVKILFFKIGFNVTKFVSLFYAMNIIFQTKYAGIIIFRTFFRFFP